MARPRQTVDKALRQELPPSSSLLLAVSGGVDSMGLLQAASDLSARYKLKLEVAHVDHRLRRSSGKDAEFVARAAEKLGLRFHLKEAGKPSPRENIEAWGRRLRYAFFGAVLKRRRLDWVVTAHTASDAAETLLMRLFANKELFSIERRDEARRLLRPMLEVSREEVLHYALQHNVPYSEDESNQDTRLLRNRVRHLVMPLLRKQFDPRMDETLAQRALALAEDIRALYALSDEAAARIAKQAFGTRAWLRAVKKELAALPPAAAWRLAERLFKPKLGFNLGRGHAGALAEFLSGRTEGIELPGGLRLTAKGGGVKLVKSGGR